MAHSRWLQDIMLDTGAFSGLVKNGSFSQEAAGLGSCFVFLFTFVFITVVVTVPIKTGPFCYLPPHKQLSSQRIQ